MKKIILLFAILFSLAANAQSNSSEIKLVCSANQRVHQSDSVQLWAIFNSGGIAATNINWSGPTGIAIAPKSSWPAGGNYIDSYAWLSGLAPGVYPFSATGLTATGLTTTVYDTLTVIANPPARSLTGLQVMIDGQLITIPLTGSTATYSDGAVIKQ